MTLISGDLRLRSGALGHVVQRITNEAWNKRFRVQGILDSGAWTAGFLGAWLLLGRDSVSPAGIVMLMVAAMLLQGLVGWAFRLYHHRYPFGSFAELGSVGISTILIALALVMVTADQPALTLLASLTAVVLMTGTRYVIRLGHDAVTRPKSGEPVVVVGAGSAAESLIRQMLTDPDSPYLPVGIVDDDPRKRRLRISGVPVVGTTADLPQAAVNSKARGVIVAIVGTEAAFLRECRDRLDGTGIWLRTIPSLTELVNRTPELDDIRQLNVEDVIGRSPIHTDLGEIAQAIAGRRVLVTGAGGSIGSELCRQLWTFEPESLIMLDRDETALHGVELSIMGSALLTSSNTALADIRDQTALDRIFVEARPEIVFHAAALKHLPMLQRFPLEGWKTNVHGTLNVLEAARKVGVETFVNISTDKAAAPTSELGRSKRIGERLVAAYARSAPGTYLSVRFGNVLGSRGSVLLAFQEQLRNGGPLTVTDPNVTRYFMTIPEACQLVLQAAAIGDDGSVMVLDMGDPVRIADIARNLIRLANVDAEIVFTGLRPGEKLDEDLFGDYETAGVQVHDKISRVTVPELAVELLPSPEATVEVVAEFTAAGCAPTASALTHSGSAITGGTHDHAV
jgi:FlaA1/EpsC-like NDP-sugar epimerase